MLIDADQVARDVVAPGQPALAALAARFGAEVLDAEGGLRRRHLAGIVFADERALADLDVIMAGPMRERTAQLMAEAARSGAAVVVHDMALLVERRLTGDYDAVVVVVADPEVRLERLLARGLDRADAEARMRSQASDLQRLAVADYVIDNSGGPAETLAQVDRIWPELSGTGTP